MSIFKLRKANEQTLIKNIETLENSMPVSYDSNEYKNITKLVIY